MWSHFYFKKIVLSSEVEGAILEDKVARKMFQLEPSAKDDGS
jgi:hypothetical protein